jgi:hypothetical protein
MMSLTDGAPSPACSLNWRRSSSAAPMATSLDLELWNGGHRLGHPARDGLLEPRDSTISGSPLIPAGPVSDHETVRAAGGPARGRAARS